MVVHMYAAQRALLAVFAVIIGLSWTNCVNAQYEQTLGSRTNAQNQTIKTWTPTPGGPTLDVIELTDSVVTLEYNCYYLTSICKNARKRLGTNNNNGQYTYDLVHSRATPRGRKVCPGNWRKVTTVVNGKNVTEPKCPQTGQEFSYRDDGIVWPMKGLEPGTVAGKAMMLAHRLVGKTKEYPGIQYTCDEFPPKTWVEGGIGLGATAKTAETICAAWSCRKLSYNKDIRAEQNWQASSHGKLRSLLVRAARAEAPGNGFTGAEPVRFNFRLVTNSKNLIPVKVIVHDVATATNDEEDILLKRDSAVSPDDLAQLTEDEWKAWLDNAANVTEHHVHLNTTWPEIQDLYDDDDDDDLMLGQHSLPLSLGSTAFNGQLATLEDRALYSPEIKTTASQATVGDDLESDLEPDLEPDLEARDGLPESSLLKRATTDEISRAEKIVNAAVAECDKLNLARMNNPARNHYGLRPRTKIGKRSGFGFWNRAADADSHPPPLFKMTPEISKAAALMAEVEAHRMNKTRSRAKQQASSFWMASIKRQGTVPFGNDASYKVFRNVMDYGAKADGVTDDSDAFIRAMNDGKRCGEKCNGSSTKNAIIYVPSGTYLLAKTVPLPFGTQFIGDATNWPVLTAPKFLLGLGMISTDQYTGGGLGADGLDQEWYINTANFYRQIRNFKFDLTNTRDRESVTAIHYQIAQATSLQFIDIKASSQQRGIFSENGSGGMISDITVHGAGCGFYGGNQQFTALRMTFDGCATAVRVIWDWGWVWKSITVKNAKVGFQLVPEEKKPSSKRQIQAGKQGSIGSASFLDSSFSDVDVGIMIKSMDETPGTGSTGIIISNTKVSNVPKMITDASDKVLLSGSDVSPDSSWVIGPTYSSDGTRTFAKSKKVDPMWKRDSDSGLLADSNTYYERAKPQYENLSAGDFMSVKSLGAKGDGVTDDSEIMEQALFNSTAARRPLFIDAGAYLITRTITVPVGAVVVGEAWSQLVASGKYFADSSHPKVMLKVGTEGDVGSVELQDLIFTTKGSTPGAILVEWNVSADKKGAAGLWDCHVRLGGATGTDLTPATCPPLTNGVNPKCQAASLMMHVTPKASGYFENMWLWVADHMIDDPALDDPSNNMDQLSVYAARGILIESQKPTWLYGTASEHSVLYQYNFNKASTIFACMIQTESPYYQPNPKPPAPFDNTIGMFESDTSYNAKDTDELSGMDASWAVVMRKSKGITIFGAGLYSWFSTYSQDCIDTQKCQKVLTLFEDNYKDISLFHLITIGAKYMASINGKGIEAKDNLNVKDHPAWSQVSVLDISGKDGSPDEPDDDDHGLIWIDPKIWPDDPQVYCDPPCTIQLPPWEEYTTTVPYPKVHWTSGTVTVDATRSDITITQWVIQTVTIDRPGGTTTSDILAIITPEYTTTPTWPPINITYTDDHGTKQTTTFRPDVDKTTFPPPPKRSDTDDNNKTKFPPKVTVHTGKPPKPTVSPCAFVDFRCPPKAGDPDGPSNGEDPDDEDDDDEDDDPDNFFCMPLNDDGSPDPGSFPPGNECKSAGDCGNCVDSKKAVCENGTCGCLLKIGPGETIPGDSDVDGSCSKSSECSVFACTDDQDPFCDGDQCSCPAAAGPSCATESNYDIEYECRSINCDTDAHYFRACVDHHCLCATGLIAFSDSFSNILGRNMSFSLDNYIHSDLSVAQQNRHGGESKYDWQYDDDSRNVHLNLKDGGTGDIWNYQAGGDNITFRSYQREDRACKPDCSIYITRSHYALDWKGRNPSKNYTVYT